MPVKEVLGVVFPVFSIIAVGYLFARFKRISLGPVVDILLYLTIPALVVSSLSRKPLVTDDLLVISAAALVVVAGTGVLSYLYLKATGRTSLRGFYLPTMFMNSGNLPFPLALLAFGADGLTAAVIYYIAVSLLVYSVGIFIAKGRGGFSEIFRLPLIYAAALGVGLNLGRVEIPGPLLTAFDMLGTATIPMMQVALGIRLHSVKLAYPGMSIAGTVIRLGGGFLIGLAFVRLLGVEGANAKVIILSSAMPAAVINFIVSHRYDVQGDLVASVIGLSTLVSLVTIPLVLIFLM